MDPDQRDHFSRPRGGNGALESHRLYYSWGGHRRSARSALAGQAVSENHGENTGGGLRLCRRHVCHHLFQISLGNVLRVCVFAIKRFPFCL